MPEAFTSFCHKSASKSVLFLVRQPRIGHVRRTYYCQRGDELCEQRKKFVRVTVATHGQQYRRYEREFAEKVAAGAKFRKNHEFPSDDANSLLRSAEPTESILNCGSIVGPRRFLSLETFSKTLQKNGKSLASVIMTASIFIYFPLSHSDVCNKNSQSDVIDGPTRAQRRNESDQFNRKS